MNCFLYSHTLQPQGITLLVGYWVRNAEKIQRCSVNTIVSYSGTSWSDWTFRGSSSHLHLFVFGQDISILNFWSSHTESVYLYWSLVNFFLKKKMRLQYYNLSLSVSPSKPLIYLLLLSFKFIPTIFLLENDMNLILIVQVINVYAHIDSWYFSEFFTIKPYFLKTDGIFFYFCLSPRKTKMYFYVLFFFHH